MSLYEGIFERASKSRASAVKAMCLQCVGLKRADVRECSDQSCPLWTWRPYQDRGPGKNGRRCSANQREGGRTAVESS